MTNGFWKQFVVKLDFRTNILNVEIDNVMLERPISLKSDTPIVKLLFGSTGSILTLKTCVLLQKIS